MNELQALIDREEFKPLGQGSYNRVFVSTRAFEIEGHISRWVLKLALSSFFVIRTPDAIDINHYHLPKDQTITLIRNRDKLYFTNTYNKAPPILITQDVSQISAFDTLLSISKLPHNQLIRLTLLECQQIQAITPTFNYTAGWGRQEPLSDKTRAVRKWKKLNYPYPAHEIHTGWLAPYFQASNAYSDTQNTAALIQYYRKTRNIILDIATQGNLLRIHEHETDETTLICVDMDLTLEQGSDTGDEYRTTCLNSTEMLTFVQQCWNNMYQETITTIDTLLRLEANLQKHEIKDDYITPSFIKQLSLYFASNQTITASELDALFLSKSEFASLAPRPMDSCLSLNEELIAVILKKPSALTAVLDEISRLPSHEEKNLALNTKDEKGRSALVSAIIKNDVPSAIALIRAGVDINSTTNSHRTALIYAIQLKNPAIASLLINNGADITISSSFGETALQEAITKKPNLVEPLLLKSLLLNPTQQEALFQPIACGQYKNAFQYIAVEHPSLFLSAQTHARAPNVWENQIHYLCQIHNLLATLRFDNYLAFVHAELGAINKRTSNEQWQEMYRYEYLLTTLKTDLLLSSNTFEASRFEFLIHCSEAITEAEGVLLTRYYRSNVPFISLFATPLHPFASRFIKFQQDINLMTFEIESDMCGIIPDILG